MASLSEKGKFFVKSIRNKKLDSCFKQVWKAIHLKPSKQQEIEVTELS